MRRAVLDLLAGLVLLTTGSAAAAPLDLRGDGLDRLAGLIERYEGATRIGWVVETASPEEGQRIVHSLELRLGPSRAHLVESVRTMITSGPPRAYAETSGTSGACSWRVTVTDPALPSPGTGLLALPLENGDILPASAEATFEVGFAGPLQSTLYAFGETDPGQIRDIAAAPDIVIPVDGGRPETLILVRARRPVPALDQVAEALSGRPGDRLPLGPQASLTAQFVGAKRGVGAFIQLVDPKMIVDPKADGTVPAAEAPPTAAPVARADLVETCIYTIMPLEAM